MLDCTYFFYKIRVTVQERLSVYFFYNIRGDNIKKLYLYFFFYKIRGDCIKRLYLIGRILSKITNGLVDWLVS